MAVNKKTLIHPPLNMGGNSDKNAFVYLVTLNTGGGVRRLFFATYVDTLGDVPGPMARYIMRPYNNAVPGADYKVASLGTDSDYVVYAQEIVKQYHVQNGKA